MYHHFSRETGTPLFDLINTGLSIRQFVGGYYTEMTNNHMTRILSGVLAEPGKIVDSDDALQRAKNNIERYLFVAGTIEKMEDVMRSLGQRFWWRHHRIPNLNHMVQPRVELDGETRKVIVESNRLDIALYEWVKARGTAVRAGETS